MIRPDVFKMDPDFLENEEKYKTIKKGTCGAPGSGCLSVSLTCGGMSEQQAKLGSMSQVQHTHLVERNICTLMSEVMKVFGFETPITAVFPACACRDPGRGEQRLRRGRGR